jgi:hypothetical protein
MILENGGKVRGSHLKDAIRSGCCASVRLLLDDGADVNKPYLNALESAISTGQCEMVELLLEAGADPYGTEEPLPVGNGDILQRLAAPSIEMYGYYFGRDDEERMRREMGGEHRMVLLKTILDRIGNVDESRYIVDEVGNRHPIFLAIQFKELEAVKVMLRHGVVVNHGATQHYMKDMLAGFPALVNDPEMSELWPTLAVTFSDARRRRHYRIF